MLLKKEFKNPYIISNVKKGILGQHVLNARKNIINYFNKTIANHALAIQVILIH